MASDHLSTIFPRVLIVSRRTLRKNKFVDFVGEYHLDLLVRYGAAPVIVPRVTGVDSLLDSFEPIHGVLLCEGEDINPSLYETESSSFSQEELEEIRQLHASDTAVDREKDSIELRLTKRCLQRNIPYLGICRGSQILNVACGGTLYQDIEKEVSQKSSNTPNKVVHMNYDNYDDHRHVIRVVENTPLHKWFLDSLESEKMEISVNSYHHQSVKRLAQRFVPMAFAPDGVIEGFYDPDSYNPEQGKFIIGLQFHPERMRNQESDDFDYPGCAAAYQEFVKAVIAYQKRVNGSRNHGANGLKLELQYDHHELKSTRTLISLQQEKRLNQMGATVRNSSSYVNRLKMKDERERAARYIIGKMSIDQLSDMVSFYHTMGQMCSEVLEMKLSRLMHE